MARSSDRGLVGVAGEYAVASELSRRGWFASLMPGGARDFDLLAHDPDNARQIALQVKTASPGRKAFQLRTAHEEMSGETNQWFAFVRFPADELARPTFHLAPRDLVAAVLWAVRAEAEARDKQVGPWRNFLPETWLGDSFCENWDDLRRPASRVRRPLPTQIQQFVKSYGRPQDRSLLKRSRPT